MIENIVALGYVLFLLGVVLMFTSRVGMGVKLSIAGVLLIAKTFAFLSALEWMRQHPSGSADTWWWVLAIAGAAVLGLLMGVFLVVRVLVRVICRTVATPEGRAALGGAVAGHLIANALTGRNARENRRIR